MENASKALLIAGGVLLMILVLSFATFFFRRMAADASDIYKNIEESDITEFNQKYLNFDSDGANTLTIQDVISIINLAKNDNKLEKFPTKVTVKFIETEKMEEKDEPYLNDLLKNNLGNKYSCSVNYANNSKFVGNITITN